MKTKATCWSAMRLPDAASLERTDATARKIEERIQKFPACRASLPSSASTLLTGVQNTYNAIFWVTLKDWSEREGPQEEFQAIQGNIAAATAQVPEAFAFPITPPAIPGVGTSGGFTFVLRRSLRRHGRRVRQERLQVCGRGFEEERTRRHQLRIPAECAAALCGCGPRAGCAPGRAHRRDLRHAADLHGRQSDQLLQSLWAAVASLRGGGGRVPNQARGYRTVLRS